MPFAATDCEFKNRFWIIGAVIFLAFFCYNLDHTNIAFALTQKILGPAVIPDSPVFDRYQLAIVTIGSLFVYLAALLRSWAESYLHSSIVHDAAIHSDQLVAEGPYRYVRNPLYLGNDLLASASASSPADSASSSWSSACSSSPGASSSAKKPAYSPRKAKATAAISTPSLASGPRSARASPPAAPSPTGATASPVKSSCGA